MAAFTHVGIESRFTKGQYGVYYAGLTMDTAIAESKFSRARLLSATDEPPQVVTMRCYHCVVKAALVDLREEDEVHQPDNFSFAQAMGEKLKRMNEFGMLYKSVRHSSGECIAILRPPALIPPTIQAGHYQFHWDGSKIAHVLSVSEFA